MPRRTTSAFSYAIQIITVMIVGLLLGGLTFYTINLAFGLFNPLFGTTVNLAIIAIFGFIIWKMRYNLYDYLHFLH